MDLVVPWGELVELIAPHMPAHSTQGGRPPFPVQTMLHIHFSQHWFNQSDPATEEALYGTPMFREFVGLDADEETNVFADAGYQGMAKREETQGIAVDWHVAMSPGKRRVLDKNTPMGAIMDKLEKTKASIRTKVEHPFRVIKRQFVHVKVRHQGLAKNTAQLHTLFALSNLWMVRRALLLGCGVAGMSAPIDGQRAAKGEESALKRTSEAEPPSSEIVRINSRHGGCCAGVTKIPAINHRSRCTSSAETGDALFPQAART